ncbi:hypothetical protein BBJ28_00001712, partial [Nothophytophthora sp. Chile5]
SYRCESTTECGSGDSRYDGICDKDGCDFNPYRMGNKTFFGPGADFTIDTSKEFTVVTRFITDDGTADGSLSEITRFYVQDGVSHEMPYASWTSLTDMNSLTEDQCSAAKTEFGDEDDHKAKGGLEQLGLAMKRGMVLTMSLWTDNAANCLWLDSDYPVASDASEPGVSRGTCATTSGVPADVIAAQPDATVVFSNIRFGDIGSTVDGVSTDSSSAASTTTTTAPSTSTTTTTAPSTSTASEADEADDSTSDAGEDASDATDVDTTTTTAPAATTSAPATSTSSCKTRARFHRVLFALQGLDELRVEVDGSDVVLLPDQAEARFSSMPAYDSQEPEAYRREKQKELAAALATRSDEVEDLQRQLHEKTMARLEQFKQMDEEAARQSKKADVRQIMVVQSDNKGVSGGTVAARLLGSTCSGLFELMIFHPVDTIAKRLMTNKEHVSGVSGFSKVIFRDAYEQPALARYRSLFPGLGFAAGYKVSQRIYKFGGQPVVKDYITKNYSPFFQSTFGERNAKTMMHATAGSMIGVGEIALLPLDVLKIRAQTNPAAIAGQGVVKIFKTEGMALYRGAGWTAARNAPGSFALFGGSAFAKEYLFQLEDFNSATFFQNFVASISGASASIIGASPLAQPLDVIKTRVQSRPFDSPESGMSVVRNLLKTEGPGALFKGLIPKLSVVGPKLVFSFAVAQHLIAYFEKSFN